MITSETINQNKISPMRILLITLTIFFILSGAVGVFLNQQWQAHHAHGPLQRVTEYTLSKGMGLNQISKQLAQEGIIDNALRFRMMTRFQGLENRLKAGDYQFPAKISAQHVLEMLHEGKTRLYSLTIPEGLTSQQIMGKINADSRLSGSALTKLPEASILPETYHFELNMKRADMISLMQKRWQQVLDPLWQNRPEKYTLATLKDVLILASIVEKEAVDPEEMPIIAGVFFNRLQRNMKLQSDPTVIYAVSAGLGKLNRRLLRSDWKFAHDHNTYYRKGLPPTPIAHPSLAAVRATLNPKNHDYIFFVADGKGGHRFAKTLKEHNNNVAQLNKLRKKLRQQSDNQ